MERELYHSGQPDAHASGYAGVRFSSNRGGHEFELLNHNLRLVHSYPPASLMTFGLVLVFVFGHFGQKPAFLRDSLWILAPLSGACLLFGFFDELRDYYEAYPVVVLLMTPSVARLMGVEVTSRADPPPRKPVRAWLSEVPSSASMAV